MSETALTPVAVKFSFDESEWVLIEDRHILAKGEQECEISPRLFQVLCLLVRQRPKTVYYVDLVKLFQDDRLRKTTSRMRRKTTSRRKRKKKHRRPFTKESLHGEIGTLRDKLGDSDDKLIVNKSGLGYAFEWDCEELEEQTARDLRFGPPVRKAVKRSQIPATEFANGSSTNEELPNAPNPAPPESPISPATKALILERAEPANAPDKGPVAVDIDPQKNGTTKRRSKLYTRLMIAGGACVASASLALIFVFSPLGTSGISTKGTGASSVPEVQEAPIAAAATPRPNRFLIPIALNGGHTWSYRTTPPPPEWAQSEDVKDGWNIGPGAFATSTPSQTPWPPNANRIWLRTTIELPALENAVVVPRRRHLGTFELFVNGNFLFEDTELRKTYYSPAVAGTDDQDWQLSLLYGALQPGKNLIGIYSKQDGPVRALDFGLDLILLPSHKAIITEPLVKFAEHGDSVSSAVFLADGRQILSAGDYSDSTIRLWDAESGKTIRQFERDAELTGVVSLAISPSERYFAIGGRDGTVAVWDLKSSDDRPICQFVGHRPFGNEPAVWRVGFWGRYDDEDTVVSAGYDGTIRFWSIPKREKIGEPFNIEGHRIRGLALDHPRNRVIYSGDDMTVRLWTRGSSVHVLPCRRLDWVWSVDLSLNGRQLLFDQGVVVSHWELNEPARNAEPVAVHRCDLLGHKRWVNSVAISCDGERALSGASDAVILWNLRTGEEIRRFVGHSKDVRSVQFSPDGRRALSASADGTVKVWLLPSH